MCGGCKKCGACFKEGGAEHKFYQMLKTSMNKQGMKDPIFAYENAVAYYDNGVW